jgi:hypothetical protein
MSIEIVHEAIAEAEAALAKLKGAFSNLVGESEADATDLEHQAETAAEPVVQAAEADGEQLAQTAAADAESVLPAPDTTTSPAA